MSENEIATIIINKAFEVHKNLGPGLLENVYQEALFLELTKAGIRCKKEVELAVIYQGEKLNCTYRLDFLVEELVVIETKSVQKLIDIHMAQTLTYLKLSNLKLGLLINFNEILLKNGIRRVVNGL